jgi:hypothetical protein
VRATDLGHPHTQSDSAGFGGWLFAGFEGAGIIFIFPENFENFRKSALEIGNF